MTSAARVAQDLATGADCLFGDGFVLGASPPASFRPARLCWSVCFDGLDCSGPLAGLDALGGLGGSRARRRRPGRHRRPGGTPDAVRAAEAADRGRLAGRTRRAAPLACGHQLQAAAPERDALGEETRRRERAAEIVKALDDAEQARSGTWSTLRDAEVGAACCCCLIRTAVDVRRRGSSGRLASSSGAQHIGQHKRSVRWPGRPMRRTRTRSLSSILLGGAGRADPRGPAGPRRISRPWLEDLTGPTGGRPAVRHLRLGAVQADVERQRAPLLSDVVQLAEALPGQARPENFKRETVAKIVDDLAERVAVHPQATDRRHGLLESGR